MAEYTAKSILSNMKLANYKIGDTIGEGAFSKVKLGQHIPTGEKVTLINNWLP